MQEESPLSCPTCLVLSPQLPSGSGARWVSQRSGLLSISTTAEEANPATTATKHHSNLSRRAAHVMHAWVGTLPGLATK
jgi:hypothetical protein